MPGQAKIPDSEASADPHGRLKEALKAGALEIVFGEEIRVDREDPELRAAASRIATNCSPSSRRHARWARAALRGGRICRFPPPVAK